MKQIPLNNGMIALVDWVWNWARGMRRVTEQEKAAIVERVAREVSLALDQVKDTLDAAGYWRLLTVARKVLCEMDRRLAIQAIINGDTNVSRTGLHAELAAVLDRNVTT